MIARAALVALSVVIAHHFGLIDAIFKVARKAAECVKCCTFWATFAFMLYDGADLLTAGAVALASSVASLWLTLLLYPLDKLYERLWQRIVQRK